MKKCGQKYSLSITKRYKKMFIQRFERDCKRNFFTKRFCVKNVSFRKNIALKECESLMHFSVEKSALSLNVKSPV